MCTEPEAMVPIATFNARHVTLIGDLNQLPPNVSSECAQNLGLGVSLISRYSDKSLQLSTQYRMVSFTGNYFHQWTTIIIMSSKCHICFQVIFSLFPHI